MCSALQVAWEVYLVVIEISIPSVLESSNPHKNSFPPSGINFSTNVPVCRLPIAFYALVPRCFSFSVHLHDFNLTGPLLDKGNDISSPF